MTTPAHKQTNPDMLPGQIVTPVKEQFHRPLYTPTRNPENMPKTLADVVKEIEESEQKLLKKKMTFDEWYSSRDTAWKRHYCHDKEATYKIWVAAQENV